MHLGELWRRVLMFFRMRQFRDELAAWQSVCAA